MQVRTTLRTCPFQQAQPRPRRRPLRPRLSPDLANIDLASIYESWMSVRKSRAPVLVLTLETSASGCRCSMSARHAASSRPSERFGATGGVAHGVASTPRGIPRVPKPIEFPMAPIPGAGHQSARILLAPQPTWPHTSAHVSDRRLLPKQPIAATTPRLGD